VEKPTPRKRKVGIYNVGLNRSIIKHPFTAKCNASVVGVQVKCPEKRPERMVLLRIEEQLLKRTKEGEKDHEVRTTHNSQSARRGADR